MQIFPEDILKLLLALALGGLIGAEREFRDKAAGFRTLMFISAGSALFTIFSVRIASGGGGGDPARIAAQIVSGIGFLGAGVILRERGEIRGLTTAATIWLAAALGVGVGIGQYLFSTLAAGFILLALLVFPYAEMLIGSIRQVNTYRVVAISSHDKFDALTQAFRENRLHILTTKRTRQGASMVVTWTVSGQAKNHNRMVELLFDDPEIQEFEM
jgi:putative Mg2+ transporter-C (MgtC) family protein